MNNLRTLTLGAVSLWTSSAALAQHGNMMDGVWGGGWFGGLRGVWLPILVVAVIVGLAVLIIRRK